LREIARIYDYLFDINPRAAKRVAEELLTAGQSLENLA
jgi:plasmid stabilization system protein ParE